MNKFDEMSAALTEAETTIRAADNVANRMAYMLRGRLRRVGVGPLKDLKKELRGFNAHTGTWKK